MIEIGIYKKYFKGLNKLVRIVSKVVIEATRKLPLAVASSTIE